MAIITEKPPVDYLEPALNRAARWFSASSSQRRALHWTLFFLVVLYFCTVVLFQTGPINSFGNDALLLLDGGWRILNGQVPYRDFYLSLGPLEYMLTALGLFLTHCSPKGIAVGNAALGAVIGTWGWFLCRRRMPDIPAVLITAWLILTATSAAPIDSSPEVLSCAMIYNRHGYAILGIILIECAFATGHFRFWDGVSSGIALVLLLFLKLSFFAAGLSLLLVVIPLRRFEMQRLWGLLTGAGLAVSAFLIYLRSALVPFLRDMDITVHSRGPKAHLPHTLMSGSWQLGFDGATALFLTFVAIALIPRSDGWQLSLMRFVLTCSVAFESGLFLSATNAMEHGCYLASLWVLILVAQLALAYQITKDKFTVAAVLTLSMATVYVHLAQFAATYKTLVRYQQASIRSAAAHIDGMEPMEFYPVKGSDSAIFRVMFEDGPLYANCIKDGMDLLLQNSSSSESVLTLGFHNPFSYLLRRKPARGGSTWLLLDDNITAAHLLSGTQVFGNADLIMLPSYPSSHQTSDESLQQIYHPYLEEHFSFVGRSQWWSLYRRRN